MKFVEAHKLEVAYKFTAGWNGNVCMTSQLLAQLYVSGPANGWPLMSGTFGARPFPSAIAVKPMAGSIVSM